MQGAIENVKLMHKCCHKHLRMETARMKQQKVAHEKVKERRMKMDRSTAGTKKCPDVLTVAQAYRPYRAAIPWK